MVRDPVAAGAPVVLRVSNQSLTDIDVDVEAEGNWIELGVVSNGKTTDFVLPEHLARRGGMRFRVSPVGTNRVYITAPIPAEPGDRVDWTIRPGYPALVRATKKT